MRRLTISTGLPTQQNWKHVSLYYDGWFMILYLSLTDSINCSMHVAFVTWLESLAKSWLLWKVLVCWLIQKNSKGNYSGQKIILTPKRQSPSMQRSLKFFQWWDPRFHTVLLNVQLPDQNWMLWYGYGVGSNFITGALPEFEDLLTLRLCMKP